ncbi:glycine cleavage system protein H [Periweissella cryptocerci]|uniref:Glycine cleavage system protein H n=1 Tax=Periweissella cryptocerci TaxID=2506420 RepID=A0A4P6YVC9_9LACO|nr:glycine cleavage system protein H [Periweissella cryptocerci]QBO36738.1 glycine cleavage system protein H [Periweissella cryptocerci]
MEKWYWIEKTGQQTKIGLSPVAQDDLGEIAFVELPAVGTKVELDKPFVSIEATKAVLDYDAPVSGTIIKVNGAAVAQPELLNGTSHEQNWLVELQLRH